MEMARRESKPAEAGFAYLVAALLFIPIRARASEPEHLRFFFYGRVIYDDVFGYRHTRGFGRKVFQGVLPNMLPIQFVRGGETYEAGGYTQIKQYVRSARPRTFSRASSATRTRASTKARRSRAT